MAAGDLDDLVVLHADPDVAAFIPRPRNRAEAEARLAESEHDWRERGHGMLAVLARADGRFVGRTGVKHWPEWDETEVGWALLRSEWGHGYATEAAASVIAWAFASLRLPYLTAMIEPANVGSLAVARRLGFTRIRDDRLRGRPVTVYALSPDAPDD